MIYLTILWILCLNCQPLQQKLGKNTWVCLKLKRNLCSYMEKLKELIPKVLPLKFVIHWKKKEIKIKLFTWTLVRLPKIMTSKQNEWWSMKLHQIINQDQPEHTSSIRLDLAREWRFFVQTSKPRIFCNSRF